jgi:hypothetical protein
VNDRALWITWYDLPAEEREAYLGWAHGTYLPWLAERPGYLYAAHYASVPPAAMPQTRKPGSMHHTEDGTVPAGSRYITIVGAEHANAFGDPTPGALHAALPPAMRETLAGRSGVRENVMVEAARVHGPEEKEYKAGMNPAPCIQIGSFNCPWQHEEEVLAWYAQWRMRAMETLPGCIRTRRLSSVCGWAKHAILYEFTSLQARNEHFTHHEARHPEMKAWSDRVVTRLVHAPGSANLAERIWPGN